MMLTVQAGYTGLHHAAQGNHLEMFKMFLKWGLNKDQRNKIGKTPLHLAVQAGNQEIVEFLLELKCNLDLLDMVRN